MAGFLSIVTETLPAGLLPQIACGLHISQAMAGQLVTIYAAGSLIAALPLVTMTQSWPRKPLLLAAVAGFLVSNSITGLSSDLALTMAARFLAGVCAGLSWGMVGGFARRMVIEPLKGRSLAIAMVGTPVALSIGVPLGTFVGNAVGWQNGFLAISALAAGLIGYIFWQVPNLPGQPAEQRLSILSVFRRPGVCPVLATAFTWVTAHYILYTYIAPFSVIIGFAGRVDLLLLVFGCASLGGIWLAGMMVDCKLRLHVLTSILLFAASISVFWMVPSIPAVVFLAVLLWGATFGGAATSLQTAASDAAGEGVDIVGAMLTTVWNAAIAGGGIIGAMFYHNGIARDLLPAMLALVAAAYVIAVAARRHGFIPGPRSKR
ncbi:MFS transporter [Sphingomonas sp. CFBP 13720]|uniref:MFS transporter n=1 Tax=Sphingomonas sp. CFBP 13720 TaxID=2775302 RepID=UPI001783C7CA|nr:MFS transporter [Sphingomonas sp. CFBP 13720]MBD8680104.1 MFS transporter [Sphingomonas sp. CFBP 13720]